MQRLLWGDAVHSLIEMQHGMPQSMQPDCNALRDITSKQVPVDALVVHTGQKAGQETCCLLLMWISQKASP